MEKIRMVLAECGIDETCQCEECQEIYAELTAAEEALEKQTAKKSIVTDDFEWTCPTCKIGFTEMYEWSYCPNCGQKLLWED